MNNPSILISNDDGIYSDGIYALWEAMSKIGKTTVVAPNTEKSAVGHAITSVSYTHLTLPTILLV